MNHRKNHKEKTWAIPNCLEFEVYWSSEGNQIDKQMKNVMEIGVYGHIQYHWYTVWLTYWLPVGNEGVEKMMVKTAIMSHPKRDLCNPL